MQENDRRYSSDIPLSFDNSTSPPPPIFFSSLFKNKDAIKCQNFENTLINHQKPFSYCNLCKLILCKDCMIKHVYDKTKINDNHSSSNIIYIDYIYELNKKTRSEIK